MGLHKQDRSLNEIMNDMVARLHSDDFMVPDDRAQANGKTPPRRYKKQDEMEHYLSADPVLARLHKDYLEAQDQLKTLKARFGADDAMAEIVAELRDSAECAVQTRLIEIRNDKILMERILESIRVEQDAIACAEAERIREKEYKRTEMFLMIREQVKKLHGKNTSDAVFEWLILFLLLRMRPFCVPLGTCFAFNRTGLGGSSSHLFYATGAR